MKITVRHENYGEIHYEENFWTGSKSITIGGTALEKISKKEFKLQDGSVATVSGGFLQGACLNINGEAIRLIPKLKWYEIVLCVLPFILAVTWGNIPAAVAIVPLVGGAIGGAIGGLFSVLALFGMRSVKPIWLKILIAIACLGVTFGICCGIGYAFLSIVS